MGDEVGGVDRERVSGGKRSSSRNIVREERRRAER